METRTKELMDIREKIIKNSMLILLLQAVLGKSPLVTLGYSILKTRQETAESLKAAHKNVPNYAQYAVVAYLSQRKIWLGIKHREEEAIWQNHFPMQAFTLTNIKRFINFAYASYNFNSAKTDNIFSLIPSSLYPIFAENGISYFNYWKLGYTKKAKKEQVSFNEEAFIKYKSDLNFRLQKYQAVACVLIQIIKKGACTYKNRNYGELEVQYDAETLQLILTFKNYENDKINSKVIPLYELHPRKYDNHYIGLHDILMCIKGCS